MGEFETAGDAVDGDDGVAFLDLGCHDYGEADGTEADDEDGVAGTCFGSVDYGAGAGHQAAAERTEHFEVVTVVGLDEVLDVDDAGFVDETEAGEAALAEKFAADVLGAGRLGPDPVVAEAVEDVEGLTVGWLLGRAEVTGTA